jgi:hypothetical protein
MGTGFLMGIDIFHGYGFGTAKPSGFVPVAISTSGIHEKGSVPIWQILQGLRLQKEREIAG